MEHNVGNKSDAADLEAIRKGSRQAFDSFCRRHYGSMLSYGCLFLPREPVEDIIQDILLNLWINRTKIIKDGCTTLDPYLFKSVYHRCMNFFRHEKSEAAYRDYSKIRYASIMNSFLDPDNNPTIVQIFSSELHTRFEEAIDSLPPKCREVFRLCYIDGLSEKEVADRLGLALKTVENHVHNALTRLKEIFSENSETL